MIESQTIRQVGFVCDVTCRVQRKTSASLVTNGIMLSWVRLVSKLLVIGGSLLAAYSGGGSQGYPIVLLQQLRKEDSPIKLDLDTSSWIGSMQGLAGITSIAVLAIMQWRGRKIAFMIASFIVLLGWIVAYCANSISVILLSEFIQGLGANSLNTITIMSLSEMTAPKFRNISIQFSNILRALGLATSGVLSSLVASKYICLIMLVPIILAFVVSFFWTESPYWLACKGKFDDTYSTFKKLRTMDALSKKELDDLIAAQRENLSKDINKTISLGVLLSIVKRRDFYVPSLHIFLLMNLIYWSGSGIVLINSFEIIQKTSQNDNAALLGSIIVNVSLFFSLLISSILNKTFKNKTILLSSCVCTVSCLTGIFIVNLLQSLDFVSKKSLIPMYFLIAYITFDSLGILPLVYTIVSELMPVKHRGVGSAVFIIINTLLVTTSMKLSPYLIACIDIWGTFLLYTLNAIVCGLLIWRFVPETKLRTLQEIEDFYMFGKFIERRTDDKIYIAE